MRHILSVAQDLVKGKGVLLYCTQFGSHLYGTESADSDNDYQGLFLPTMNHMLLGRYRKSFSYTTGDTTSRNTACDVDIQLWSLQSWLEMLRDGAVNAIDLLFSMQATHVHKYDSLQLLKQYKPMALMDLRHSHEYLAYVRRQAKKYGLKGSRMGILKEVLHWMHTNPVALEALAHRRRAGVLFDVLVQTFYDASYFFSKEGEEGRLLYILGKGYSASIAAEEMLHRLQVEFDKHGERVRQAENNEGIDWKALSHAVRCMHQLLEILDTGSLRYPLATAPLLKEIKQGRLTWREVETMLLELVATAEERLTRQPSNNTVQQVHDTIVLQQYGRI